MNPTTALALLYSYATIGELVLPENAENLPEAEFSTWTDHLEDGCTDKGLARRYTKMIAGLDAVGDTAYEIAKRFLNQPHADLVDLPIRDQSVDSMVALTSTLSHSPCREWLDFQAARTAMMTACWLPMRKEEELNKVWVDGVLGGTAILYWHRLKRMWSINALKEYRPRDYAKMKHIGEHFANCEPNELGQLYQEWQAELGNDGDLALQMAKTVSGLSPERPTRDSPGQDIFAALGAMNDSVSDASCREWIDFQAARAALVTAYFLFPQNPDYHLAWSEGLVGPLTICYLLSLISLKSCIAGEIAPKRIESNVWPFEQLYEGHIAFACDVPPGNYYYNLGRKRTASSSELALQVSVSGDDRVFRTLGSLEPGEVVSSDSLNDIRLRKRSTLYVLIKGESTSSDEWQFILKRRAGD